MCGGSDGLSGGIVDARDGTIHSALKKYEDALKLDLAGWARSSFDLHLRIENDARMALMGEHYAGAGRGVENLVMMTLGTEIGSAATLHGRLLRDVHGHAGGLSGHLTVKFDGRLCNCGNIGCAEAEASGWSMPLVAREWKGFAESTLAEVEKLGFLELFTHAEHGDKVACEVRERCLHVWAANAVSLIHAYDPETLILGGGVMKEPVGERQRYRQQRWEMSLRYSVLSRYWLRRCMARKSNYDKFPFIAAGTSSECAVGWDAIALQLADAKVVCVECYPGAQVKDLQSELKRTLQPDAVICTSDCYKTADEIHAMLAPYLARYTEIALIRKGSRGRVGPPHIALFLCKRETKFAFENKSDSRFEISFGQQRSRTSGSGVHCVAFQRKKDMDSRTLQQSHFHWDQQCRFS